MAPMMYSRIAQFAEYFLFLSYRNDLTFCILLAVFHYGRRVQFRAIADT